MDTIIDIIQSLGFPIAICIWLLYDKLKIQKQILDAINNNTTALRLLEKKLDK